MDSLIAVIQTAALFFIGWGAFLCVFRRDRRIQARADYKVERRRSNGNVICLPDMAKGRRTDFTIGFREQARGAA